MSDTSIHFKDEGYTSPDFLTNLFKKPLYTSFSMSSFESHPHSEREIHSSTKQNSIPEPSHEKKSTSPLKFKNHTSNTIKSFKSTPTIDQQKISNSKYKIFFKTLLHGTMNEQQVNQLWGKLEESIKNPFSFDRFIDELKNKKDKEAEAKNYKEFKESLKQVVMKVKSKTPQKQFKRKQGICPNTQLNQKSTISERDVQAQIKQKLRRDVIEVRQILLKGERIMRQK